MKGLRYSTLALTGVFWAAAAACHTDQPLSERQNEAHQQQAVPVQQTLSTLAAAEGGFVSSSDPQGVPTFIWAVGDHPAEPADSPRVAAERHLARFTRAFGLRASDLDTAELRFLKSLHSG